MNKAAQKLGRLGGRKTSEAKAAAAKANGAKGGRPRKTPKADAPSEPANAELCHMAGRKWDTNAWASKTAASAG